MLPIYRYSNIFKLGFYVETEIISAVFYVVPKKPKMNALVP